VVLGEVETSDIWRGLYSWYLKRLILLLQLNWNIWLVEYP